MKLDRDLNSNNMGRYTDDPTSSLNLIDDPIFSNTFLRGGDILGDKIIGTIGSGISLARFTHDCRHPPFTELEKALRFYDDNYDVVAQQFLNPDKRVFLGDKRNRRCRFCGGVRPKVTFKKVAHAVPESLGNKSLFSFYECDDCNRLFGDGIENDLGNWSIPMRTLARIKGKKGFPTMKRRTENRAAAADPTRYHLRSGFRPPFQPPPG